MVKRCAYGICKTDSRYPKSLAGGVVFFPFPKPKTQQERCLRWIKQCGRPHSQLNVTKINKHTYVCSKHFVNGQPTSEYPNPVLYIQAPNQTREQLGPPQKRCRLSVQDASGSTSSTDDAEETQQYVDDSESPEQPPLPGCQLERKHEEEQSTEKEKKLEEENIKPEYSDVTMNKCVVSGCPNRRKGPLNRVQKRFYNFPKDQARVKVWLAALRETEKQDSTEQHVLCEDHFLPQHITAGGIREDAIPIMSPYLDGVLGTASPWAEESSDEDVPWAEDGEDEEDEEEDDDEEEEEEEDTPLPPQQQLESDSNRDGKLAKMEKYSRNDVSLAGLTKALLQEMVNAPDGVLDLRQAVQNLKTQRRRLYDITNVLSSISMIKKESANKIKWIGKTPVSCFLRKSQHSFQKELSNLKTVEESLDEVIKTCARQLFDMTDNPDNIDFAYITYDDISRVEVFQDQTVVVIKAPEDTKLQVPTPSEDSILMNLKAVKGPITVVTSEMGTSTTTGGCFLPLDRSRIRTVTLNTESTNPQYAVNSS